MTTVAVFALLSYMVHGGNHVLYGTAYDLLWACNVSPVLLGAGCLFRSPRLAAVSLLWLSFGTPMWIVDVATGGELMATSFLTHVGCPVLGVIAARQLGIPKNSWALASAAILALMLLCMVLTPPQMNINLSHAVWAGWEKQFPRYDVYFAVVYGGATATFFLTEKLWIRLL